jgi:serine/threonine protein kinase
MKRLESGATLLHYRIIEKIGEGGMGEVYKAEDRKLGRHVAIKLLSSEATEDEKAKKRLLREAKAASTLNHPNIVTVYAIEEAEGLDFIAMEYVEGESLRARIERGPLEVEDLLVLGTQLARALAAAHEVGVIHRDIKPGNILTTPGGQAKLVDFGLAGTIRPQPEEVKSEEATLEALTQAGVIVGRYLFARLCTLRGGNREATFRWSECCFRHTQYCEPRSTASEHHPAGTTAGARLGHRAGVGQGPG